MAAGCCACCWGGPCARAGQAGRWVGQWQPSAQAAHADRMAPLPDPGALRSHLLAATTALLLASAAMACISASCSS